MWESMQESDEETMAPFAGQLRRRIDQSVARFAASGDLEPFTELFDRLVVMHCPEFTVIGRECVLAMVQSVRHEYSHIVVVCEYFSGTQLNTVVVRLTGSPRQAKQNPEIGLTAAVTMALDDNRITALWVTGGTSSPASSGRGSETDGSSEPDAAAWAKTWHLTRRELSVARLAMRGMRDKEIAANLNLAPASASRYVRNVMRKAGVRARWELVQRAGIICIG